MSAPRRLQRQPSFVKRPREELEQIARESLAAVRRGQYTTDFGAESHPIQDLSSVPDSTEYFTPDSFADWASASYTRHDAQTKIVLCHTSTLEGLRLCLHSPVSPTLPGILNFASATSPGGGFLYGARAQEESLARSSNLYSALSSPSAAPFYDLHNAAEDPRHTHALIRVRSVRFFRDDSGVWVSPADALVLSAAAPNVRALRAQLQRAGALPPGEDTPLPPNVAEAIHALMHERMARVLAAFRDAGVQDLVLGAFGTGAFGNDVRATAAGWVALLSGEAAPFRNVFQRVVFAVIDRETCGVFRDVFKKEGVDFQLV
ncbi:hypothetical protein FB45DRAFT_922367 [Roridomyces roridus]|uniref:Microbial-type PARG catalytic domain-containing protein n=1 Tax=Roridomyces roridus TaxID=1738132 RepID=A0AAD7BMX7_9AGAR|nr:hypothetical protein FB45DRAFT_922367 [Roridomyces roridus]